MYDSLWGGGGILGMRRHHEKFSFNIRESQSLTHCDSQLRKCMMYIPTNCYALHCIFMLIFFLHFADFFKLLELKRCFKVLRKIIPT